MEAFDFRTIDCPICESNNWKIIGYRGGEAHHSGNGVKTRIVRCLECTHLYPNPMPFPKLNLDEIYTDADEYFSTPRSREKEKQQSAVDEEL